MGHDGWTFVGVGVLVSNDPDKQPISILKRILKQQLMADMAKIIDTIAVYIATSRQQGHVQVTAKVGKDGNVVDSYQRQDGGAGKYRSHTHQDNPRMQFSTSHFGESHITGQDCHENSIANYVGDTDLLR